MPTVLATRSLASADKRISAVKEFFEVQIGGRKVAFSKQDFGLVRELWGQGTYFREPGFSIRTNDHVLDLGANVGVFTVGAALLGANVLAIEAQPDLVKTLRSNLELNKLLAMVEVRQGYVGVPACLRESGLETGSEINLDHSLNRMGWRKVDFLKVDIEGAEFSLFSGRPNWLGRVQRIAMEVHPRYGDIDFLRDKLCSAGFTVRFRDKAFRSVEKIVEQVGFCYAWRELR